MGPDYQKGRAIRRLIDISNNGRGTTRVPRPFFLSIPEDTRGPINRPWQYAFGIQPFKAGGRTDNGIPLTAEA